MLTKKDETKIIAIFREELGAAFSRIEKRLDILNANIDQGKHFQGIEKKLDEFLSIMRHFAREQKILVKKMREIEKYFDPPGRN